MRFRYEQCTQWFRGNMHTHTTRSDGGVSIEEAVQRYADAGFDFVAITDHWVAHRSDKADTTPLLVLDGIELDGTDEQGSYYHVVAIGRFDGIEREMGIAAAIDRCRSQGGVMILAHPHWTGNDLDDATRYPFDAVEIYNDVCRWLNGKGDSAYLWDLLLELRPDLPAVAVDDNHFKPQHGRPGGGWISVSTENLTQQDVMDALKRGRFYASTGPEFHDIRWNGASVEIDCSPVALARLVGKGGRGDRIIAGQGESLNHVSFTPEEPVRELRVEIEDDAGHIAWTNTLFIDE